MDIKNRFTELLRKLISAPMKSGYSPLFEIYIKLNTSAKVSNMINTFSAFADEVSVTLEFVVKFNEIINILKLSLEQEYF
jgi:glycine cleavage system regulatory protein